MGNDRAELRKLAKFYVDYLRDPDNARIDSRTRMIDELEHQFLCVRDAEYTRIAQWSRGIGKRPVSKTDHATGTARWSAMATLRTYLKRLRAR